MTPIQPVGWWHYLTHRSTLPSADLAHFFYLSWEDALWDLLKYFNCQFGSIILIPDFYCDDVIKNMESHGLKIKTYPVDSNFQTDPKIFNNHLKKYQPDLVIIFHAVGITNKLLINYQTWLFSLPQNSLLIEDAVHRIINPKKISFISDRHIIIDSLRKVVPIQGSNLYGPKKLLTNLKPTKINLTWSYQFKVIWWWLLFQFCLLMVLIFPFNRLKKWWNRQAEKTMLIGYNYIGDSQLAGSGLNFFKKLSFKINHQHIFNVKVKQAKLYQQLLTPVFNSPDFFKIKIDKSDYGNLRAFPFGLKIKNAKKILSKLRKDGLLVRFELDNFGWTNKQKVIYLPLGPHVNDKEIQEIIKILLSVIPD